MQMGARRTAKGKARQSRPDPLWDGCEGLRQQFETRAFAPDGSANPEFVMCIVVLFAGLDAAEAARMLRLVVAMLMDVRFNQFAVLGVLDNMDDASMIRNIVEPAAAMGRAIEARTAEIAASIAPEAWA